MAQVRDGRQGWTYSQVSGLELPYGWDLIEGEIVARGRAGFWHREIRDTVVTALGEARRAPYAVFAEQCVYVDEFTAVRPDVVVFDESVADMYTAESLPAAAAVLVVEIVSVATKCDNWFRKPRLYAAAGIANFWRVERGDGDVPIVYQYWLDHESGEYIPAPAAVHTETLATAVPYPIRIDLSAVAVRDCAGEPRSRLAPARHRTGGARSMRSRCRSPWCGS